MRLNRGTIVLLLASLAVIVIVLLLSSNQASAPEVTPVAATAETIGQLFAGLTYDAVNSVEVINNQTGEKTLITKHATGDWQVAEATYATDRAVDQPAATGWVTRLAELQANESFASEKLSDFGLTDPAYVVHINTDQGDVHTIYIGNRNPTGNRYYTVLETVEGDAPPAEATSEATSESTPEATAEVTPEAAEVTVEATAEAAPEVTEDAAEAMVESTAESTPEPYQGITLDESGTVYLVSVNALDEVIGLITAPPYVPPPTATPTPTATLNPMSEVEQATATAQAGVTLTAFANMMTDTAATATAAVITPLPTVEVTAEATEAAG